MNNNKNIKILIISSIILVSIILIGLFLIMSKPNQKLKDMANFKNIGNAISSINLKNDLNDEISSTNYFNSLEKKISSFKDIQSTINSLEISTENSALLNKLNEGLSLNIDFFNQLSNILKSPNSDDLQDSYNAAMKIKDNCEDIYKYCSENEVPITLSANNEYLDKILYYINQLIKVSRDSDISIAQKNDFIVSLDRIYRGFLPLTEDLFKAIDLIKKDNRDINILISDIHNKILELQNIENELFSLSKPSNGISIFNSLESCLKLYENYINTLLKGIIEDSSNNEHKVFYDEAKSIYNEVLKALNEFESEFDNYKNN